MNDIIVKVGADITDFSRKMSESTRKLQEFGRTNQSTFRSFKKVGAASMAAGTAIGVGLGGAVKTAANFEQSMSNVKAISGATGEEFNSLRDKAMEMGAKTAYSASESADAMANLAQMGWKTDDILAGIEHTLNLAAAGKLELADAAMITANTINQFGLEASDAGRIADVFAATSSSAGTDVEEMAHALQYAGANASAAGMDIEQTAAFIGVLGDAGITGSKAGTALNAMLRDLKKNAEDGAIAVGEQTVALYDANGEMRPMPDVIADIVRATENMSDEQRDAALSAIFGEQALGAFNAIAGKGADAVSNLADELYNAKGTAKEVADEQMANLIGALTELSSAFESVQIAIGAALIPAIEWLADMLKDLLTWFNELDESTQQKIAILTALSGVFLFVGGAALTFIGYIPEIIGGFTQLINIVRHVSKILLGLTNPWIIVAIIAGIAVALIIKYWEPIKEFFINLWDSIKEIGTSAWQGMVEVWESAVELFKELWSHVSEFFAELWEKIIDVSSVVWEPLKELWAEVVEFFTEIWSDLVEFFTELWDDIVKVVTEVWDVVYPVWDFVISYFLEQWENVVNNFKVLWEFITQIVVDAWDYITTIIDTAMTLIVDLITVYWDMVKSVISLAMDVVKSVIDTVWNVIKTIISTILDVIITVVKSAWDVIKTVISTVMDVIKTVIDTVWNVIKGLINVTMSLIKGDISGAWDAILGIITTILGAISSIMMSVWYAIEDLITTVLYAIWDIVESVWDGILQTIDSILSGIESTISTIFNGFIGIVADALTGVVDAVTSGLTDAWNAVIDFKDSFFSAGKDLIQGMIDGFLNMGKAAVEAITGVVDGVVNKAKSMLKIKSPSRVFMEIGKYTGEGLVDGIDKTVSDAEKASSRLVGALIPDKRSIDMSYNTPTGARSTLSSAVRGTVDVNAREDLLARSINSLERKLTNLEVVMDSRQVGRIVEPHVTERQEQTTRSYNKWRLR